MVPRTLPTAVAAACGVVGSLVAVVIGRMDEPDAIPANEVAIALTIATYTGVGLVIASIRPANTVGRLMLIGAAAWGTGEGLFAFGLHGHLDGGAGAEWFAVLGTAIRAFGWLVLVLAVPLFFPDGRLPWRGRMPAVVLGAAVGLFTMATLVAPVPLDRRLEGMDSPTGFPPELRPLADALALGALALCGVALLVSIAGLVHRWRSGDELRHQQILWLGVSFALPVLFLPVIATAWAEPWMFALVTLPVPVAVAVAVLQRRLYDIQLAATQTLTYLGLSAVVAALYLATVAGVGAVLDERGADWLPWLATGVVAVTFAPLRNALQRGVNRITYGQWSQPAEVLRATARRLSDATDTRALLDSLVADMGESLNLRRVELRDLGGRLLAAHGPEVEELHDRPLTAFGEDVGRLRWSTDRNLRDVDRRLLDDVAQHIGAAVHSAGLVDSLRQAQQRLVVAREEERRRLRRDLHDGLGPALASLTLRVDTLRNTWRQLDPDPHLLDLRSAIQETVADVRRIVEGLRPAPLDDLGLAAALEQIASRRIDQEDIHVEMHVDCLPPLPAAAEVAAFHIVQEALTNVRRHSGATRACVNVMSTRNALHLEVRDDGRGAAHHRPGGVGLTSMKERTAELGGSLEIESSPGGGTTISVTLPISFDPSERRTP